MHNWSWIIIILYGIGLLFIFSYSLVQLNLLIKYLRAKKTGEPLIERTGLPRVLVQLPVYNEFYVVERLIDAAAKLNYPSHLLEIQVLDDSSDESFDIAAEKVAFYKGCGIKITHVRRPERTGFKAGALAYGLELSDAPFVAVFDADFVPDPDFLLKTMQSFADPNIGLVQARWEHLNKEYSLLTRVQAFGLDAHFTVEQGGRNLGGHFINFNGTAGIWRRECILDAGGWSADTLTEDLDLSYRAQMKGWKFLFREDIGAPAELPAEMNALKNQQYRWNKGAAECAVKHLSAVSKHPQMTFNTKVHAFFHLLNSSVFIWIVICAVLSIPLMYLKVNRPELKGVFWLGATLIFSFVVLGAFYFVAFRKLSGKTRSFFWLYPAFLSLSMGMSLHNSRAVLLGYLGRKTPFVRTPKWNLVGKNGSLSRKKYLSLGIKPLTWVEGLFGLYFTIALIYGIKIGEYGFIPLHAMLVFGFISVFVYSVKHVRQ